MSRSINDQQPRYFNIDVHNILIQLLNLFFQFIVREKWSSDLLGDSSFFSRLDFSISDVIQNFGFACVYMTHDANDWASVFGLEMEILMIVCESLILLQIFFLLFECFLLLSFGLFLCFFSQYLFFFLLFFGFLFIFIVLLLSLFLSFFIFLLLSFFQEVFPIFSIVKVYFFFLFFFFWFVLI